LDLRVTKKVTQRTVVRIVASERKNAAEALQGDGQLVFFQT
jgi:hypothetical protein